MWAIVREEEDLREPHTGDDKGPPAGQPLGGAGFAGASWDNPLQEPLDRLAPGRVEGMCPRRGWAGATAGA